MQPLEDDTEAEALKCRKIELAKDIKRFALQQGVDNNRSFVEYNPAIAYCYLVFAAEPDGLVSVIQNGRLPFVGFWNLPDTRRVRQEYDRQGYHTRLAKITVAAERSMPITNVFLRESMGQILLDVGHENGHIHLQACHPPLPLWIEEPVVDVFAAKLAQEYTDARNFPFRLVQKQLDYWEHMRDFIVRYVIKLEQAYESGVAAGQEVLLDATPEAQELGILKKISDGKLNNAYFTSQWNYFIFQEPVARALSDFTAADILNHPIKLRRRLSQVANIKVK